MNRSLKECNALKTISLFKIIGSFFITMSLVLLTFTNVLANESYDYTFDGIKEEGGYIGNSQVQLIKVKDNKNNQYDVYCIDNGTDIKGKSKYSVMNLEDANYYSKENATKITNIVMNAYPYITIEKLRLLTGITDLSKKDAIAGTQAAIWKYSNNKSDMKLLGNVSRLYDWYIESPTIVEENKTKVADIDINYTTSVVNGKYQVEILYKANGKNSDSSNVEVLYKIDKNLGIAKIENLGINDNGYNIVRISNISKNTNFNFLVEGKQTLSRNAYFYMPEGGTSNSQSLVGVKDDVTNISKSIEINLKNSGYTLTLNNIDALTSNSIEGAEFAISKDKDFKEGVINVKTDSDGKAKVPELNTGSWYIKETKAPSGYIPNTKVFEIYINERDKEIDLKSSKYAKLQIIKVDENKNAVAGAKFRLYKGITITDENIQMDNLTSDENGKVFIEELLPGNYTLLETEAPEGYIKNSKLINFDVEAYGTAEITHINETIGYCKMNIYKKDAVTKELLEGTKIGIYSDSEFKNLVKEIITTKNGAVVIDDLRPGTYYIKELEAPKDYLLDAAPKKVTLGKNETAEIEFYNSKNFSTAGNYATVLEIGLGVMLIATAGLIITNKRRFVRRVKNLDE